QRARAAGLMGAGLFGLGLLGVCLREYRWRRVYTGEDVASAAGVPLLGALPTLSAGQVWSTNGASGNPYDRALLTVSVSALRDNLLRGGEHPPRVLLITSASGEEGKTALAAHLAASLARTGGKTLFIDGALLRPQAHRAAGLAAQPGFSEVLRGEGG